MENIQSLQNGRHYKMAVTSDTKYQ